MEIIRSSDTDYDSPTRQQIIEEERIQDRSDMQGSGPYRY